MDRHIAPINRFDADDVERIEDRQLYSGFFGLEKRRLRHRQFNGEWSETIDREVHVRRDAVGVLLYDPACDKVVLVESPDWWSPARPPRRLRAGKRRRRQAATSSS